MEGSRSTRQTSRQLLLLRLAPVIRFASLSRVGRSTVSLPRGTLAEYERAIRLFTELHGDLPVSEIRRRHAREFR